MEYQTWNIATVLSAILFIASLYAYKKTNPSKINRALFFVIAFSSMLLFITQGVVYYFTGDGIDEAVIYHLKYGLGGAGFLEYSWLIASTVIILVSGGVWLLWFLSNRTKQGSSHISRSITPYSLLLISLFLNPSVIDIYNLQRSFVISTDFYDYYKKPYIKTLGKDQKNIIFIYAESLERTYFDETTFPGLIKGLSELESKSTFFTNIRQVTGTGWTIAGMTASQCGIPLFTPSHGNSMSGMNQFLGSAVCLGDLLKDEGYHLTYMAGADLDFAGKGKLFKTHGFTEVLGRKQLLPKLEDEAYKTGWGLFDDSLFEMVYGRFIELSELGEQFGLFTLTLDTHHPNGHPSKSCENTKYLDGSNPILNAVACSDYLITDFINKIIQSPYADQTVVVLMSDHLAMRNTASDLLRTKDRRDLFMIIDPGLAEPKKIQSIGSTLDIGTTLLSYIGYTGDIGLGHDLLNYSGKTEVEKLYIHTNLAKWRKPIMEFWGFPKIQEYLEINIDEEIVKIDNKSFQMPLLIELNAQLESTLKFQFNSGADEKTLVQHLQEIDENKYFVLIDRCENVRKLDETVGDNGFCLLAGQGKKYTRVTKLNNIIYTANDIRQLLKGFTVNRVAHAGGGINNKTYTNSIEALDSNIKKGFLYFEIDFSFTKDGRLVCLHDWEDSFKRSFGFETAGKVTLREFDNLVKSKSDFQKCTATSLAEWMRINPSAYIVTDVKEIENNIEALKIMLKILPNAKTRVIPQVYNPENLEAVKDLGFVQMIWTLYRFSGNSDEVLGWMENFHSPIAITMPKYKAESTLPKDLAKRKIPTYVHTVNKSEEAEKYITVFGVSEIYTDFLRP